MVQYQRFTGRGYCTETVHIAYGYATGEDTAEVFNVLIISYLQQRHDVDSLLLPPGSDPTTND